MSTITKVFVVLTTVLSIVLSCLFIASAAQWDNYRKLAQRYQQERTAAIVEAQNLAASLQAALAMKDDTIATLQRDLADAETRIADLTGKLGELQTTLAEVRDERLKFENDRTTLQQVLDVTTAQLQAAQKQLADLLNKNIDLQSRNTALNSRVLELTTQVTILTDEIRNAKEKLVACEKHAGELEQALAQGGAVAPAAAPASLVAQAAAAREIRGRITAVQDSYASIDIGQDAGVVPGMTFLVYREGGVYLGELVIEKVRPKEAGGRLSSQVTGEIRKGDLVVAGIR